MYVYEQCLQGPLRTFWVPRGPVQITSRLVMKHKPELHSTRKSQRFGIRTLVYGLWTSSMD